jgi:PAS domain S-box-containing protein
MADKLTDDKFQLKIQDVFKTEPSHEKEDEDMLKYRFLTEHMADVIWTIDLNLRTTYVSPSIQRILGFTPKERMQQSAEEMITPDSLQSVVRTLSEEIQRDSEGVADPERSIRIEVEYYKKDGSTIWMENHLKAIRDAEGQMIGILGVSRDISLQIKNKQQLMASKNEWENIFNAIGHPAMIIDADHKIINANQATLRLSGLNKTKLKGRACFDIFHHNTKPPESCPLEAILRNGSRETVEMEMEAVNGTFLVSCTPIINHNDQILKFIHIATDITEKKKLETQLRQTQKAEALGTLAGGIAHEFNNILGIIIGNTELAMDDVGEWNSARNFLDEISRASLRAKEVVRQILSFSLKTPSTRKPVKISSIIHETLKLIRSTTPTAINIRQKILCDRETVLSNPSDISQILINLCSNAIHAMMYDTGILEIRLEPSILDEKSVMLYEGLTTGAYIKLTVKDSGKGIEAEIMDRICDPYFTTKDIDEGLGMGLAVVSGIVKKHDGAIKFDSQPGKGTTVAVLLPMTGARMETDKQATADLPVGSECILLVDDEASLVKMLKLILERQGYKVVGKTSSLEALKLLQQETYQFDLVITDMSMPEMPGDRLSKEIMKTAPDLPIILCTGYSDRLDEKKAKDLGISAFVMKPYEKKDLLHTVRNVLDKSKNPKF